MTEKIKETDKENKMGSKKELSYDDMYPLISEYLKKYYPTSNEVIEAIWEHSRVLTCNKKETIVIEGNKANSLFLIVKGFCASFYYKEDGQESICHFMVEGEFCFLPHAFLKEENSTLSIRTMTDVILLSLCREHYLDLKSQYPEFKELIHAVLEKSSIEHELHYYNIRRYNATERIQNAFNTTKIQLLQKHIPQCYIASYLNIAPETFSSLKRKLHNKKK